MRCDDTSNVEWVFDTETPEGRDSVGSCDRCGALVISSNEGDHVRWHESLGDYFGDVQVVPVIRVYLNALLNQVAEQQHLLLRALNVLEPAVKHIELAALRASIAEYLEMR